MKQATDISKTETAPLFTTRDTCVGLAACMGIGLLTSITLSVIILVLSATSSVHADDKTAELTQNKLFISSLYSPEAVLSQNCDRHIGKLRNITVGDKLSFLNEAQRTQYFRVTGIQAVDSKPEIMPVIDEASMLTLVTCYISGNSSKVKAITYLVMIEELDASHAMNTNTLPNI